MSDQEVDALETDRRGTELGSSSPMISESVDRLWNRRRSRIPQVHPEGVASIRACAGGRSAKQSWLAP